MKINIQWQPAVELQKNRDGFGYGIDLEKIPKRGGVYVFYRQWGKSKESLYVGRSKNLRSRMKAHLNSVKLMRHLIGARNGKLYVRVGVCKTKAGSLQDKKLAIAEKALIRYFIAEGHELSNQQGTILRMDEIQFAGRGMRGFIPKKMNVQKTR